jgi:hypothetical protein
VTGLTREEKTHIFFNSKDKGQGIYKGAPRKFKNAELPTKLFPKRRGYESSHTSKSDSGEVH